MRIEETPLPASIFIDLDRNGPIPMYYQLSSRLENAIREGVLAPGSRLENEVSLSARLNLSRPTVRRGIQELVNKGLLVRRRGIGTQVVQGKVTRGLELTSLHEDLGRDGQHPTTELLLHEVIPAPADVAVALGLAEGDPVVHIRRRRLSDDTPLAVLENFLPPAIAPFDSELLKTHGLYQLMRSTGTTLQIAKQRIGARGATTEESHLLDISNGRPVLTTERVSYDNGGVSVELGRHCYRPDLYSFEVTLLSNK